MMSLSNPAAFSQKRANERYVAALLSSEQIVAHRSGADPRIRPPPAGHFISPLLESGLRTKLWSPEGYVEGGGSEGQVHTHLWVYGASALESDCLVFLKGQQSRSGAKAPDWLCRSTGHRFAGVLEGITRQTSTIHPHARPYPLRRMIRRRLGVLPRKRAMALHPEESSQELVLPASALTWSIKPQDGHPK